MNPRRGVVRLLAVWIALLPAAACAVRRAGLPLHGHAGTDAVVGFYRGRLETSEGERRRFRLLLFARPPDRIRAELLSPLGSTQLVLDGGGGMLAVTVVREKTSYVGPARPEILERILGFPMTLHELVESVWSGASPAEGFTVARTGPGPPGGLPRTLRIRSEEARLDLELKQLRGLPRGRGEPGNGRPLPGTAVRPLEELRPEQVDEELPRNGAS